MLFRHLPGYLIGPDRMLIGLLPVPEVVPQVNQRQGNEHPHQQQGNHGGKRHRPTAVLAPDEEVEEEARAGDDARIEDSSPECRPFPLATLHGFVEAGRVVAGHDAVHHVEGDGGSRQGSPRRWRQHTQHREDCTYLKTLHIYFS